MKKKRAAIAILIVFFLIILFAAFKYIKFSKEYATTDAVFVRSDKITNLSFKRVEGKIVSLYANEGDNVKKGDILAAIDPVDYKIKLNQIQMKTASLKNRKKELLIKKERIEAELKIKENKIKKNIEMLKEKLKGADYKIAEIEDNIKQTEKDYGRYKIYLKKMLLPKEILKIFQQS